MKTRTVSHTVGGASVLRGLLTLIGSLGLFVLGAAADAGAVDSLVSPQEAAAAGCAVEVLGQLGNRVFLSAEPGPGWEFSHWDESSYLNHTFSITYALDSELPPTAVFVPREACECCRSSSGEESADTRETIPIPAAGGFWRGFCAMNKAGCCDTGLPPIRSLGGTSIQFETAGSGCDTALFFLEPPMDVTSLDAVGLRLIASSNPPALLEVTLGSRDPGFVDPFSGENDKGSVATCLVETARDRRIYDIPFEAFELIDFFPHHFPHLNSDVYPRAVVEVVLRSQQPHPATIKIHEVAFYKALPLQQAADARQSLGSPLPGESVFAAYPGQAPEIIHFFPDFEEIVERPDDWLLLPTWYVHGPDKGHAYGARNLANLSFGNRSHGGTLATLPPSLEDAYIEDLDGMPVFVDGGDHVYLSLMDPAFRNYLRLQMQAMIDAGSDGFWFDETSGVLFRPILASAGPFDEYCAEAFRRYLMEAADDSELPRKLHELGIADHTSSFDYRAFIIQNGYADLWRADPGDVPLYDEYRRCLLRDMQRFQAELFDDAKGYARARGQELAISVNADPYWPQEHAYYESVDFYFYEHSYLLGGGEVPVGVADAPAAFPAWPWLKYARGRGQFLGVLPPRNDTLYLGTLDEDIRTQLVLHFFAEAFAHRGTYSIPFQHPDDDCLFLDKTALYPYCAFIRENTELLVDLESCAKVAVIPAPHPRTVDWGETRAAIGLSLYMGRKNVNHDVLSVAALRDHHLVFALGTVWSDEEIDALLQFVERGGSVVVFDENFASLDVDHKPARRPVLEGLLDAQESTHGAGSFLVLDVNPGVRYYKTHDPTSLEWIDGVLASWIGRTEAPEDVLVVPYRNRNGLVLHILNYGSTGLFLPRENLSIAIEVAADIPDGSYPIAFRSPDIEGQSMSEGIVRSGRLSLTVPLLRIWSVAELHLRD